MTAPHKHASEGSICVYFKSGVTRESGWFFANYLHVHLETGCETVQRLRYWVWPKCSTPKGNPEVPMENLRPRQVLATA